MSCTPIHRKPAHTREEMQEQLDELRERSGITARVELINERDRIRLLALKEAEKNKVPGAEGSFECRDALVYFASLLEER